MSGSNKVAMTDRDRISNLPEHVIGDILSRLSTEDAVKTSVLSKSWKYKWTFINQIIIDDEANLRLRNLDPLVFVKCVERTLVLVQNATRIKIMLESEQSSDALKSWMESLSSHTVEELELYIKLGNFVLSSSLLNLTRLRDLDLTAASFVVSSKNQFPNLTNLFLVRVNVMNQNVGTDGTLMCTFPVLEILVLFECIWFNVKYVEIHAPALTVLGLISPIRSVEHDYTISIHCSRLADFRSGGSCLQENLILNGSAVVRAEFYIYDGDDQKLRMSGVKVRSLLGQTSSSLKCLKLTVSVAKAILESKQESSYPHMRFEKLELLSLQYLDCGHPCGIQALLEFLHAAPSLEHLSIELAGWTEFDRDTIESLPSCITSSLKLVELTKYREDRPRHSLEKLFQEAGVRMKRCKSNDNVWFMCDCMSVMLYCFKVSCLFLLLALATN